MDELTRMHLTNLQSGTREQGNDAYAYLMQVTEQPVDWAYEIWDDTMRLLTDKDNHRRAIAAQLLCNLAKSDPEERIIRDFDRLLNVTRDEKFVTARHCLQNLWKVGAAGIDQQVMLENGLEQRFMECASEKNCTLIRYDIIESLRNLYNVVKDEKIRAKALALIESESDPKYKKKYATLWKDLP